MFDAVLLFAVILEGRSPDRISLQILTNLCGINWFEEKVIKIFYIFKRLLIFCYEILLLHF